MTDGHFRDTDAAAITVKVAYADFSCDAAVVGPGRRWSQHRGQALRLSLLKAGTDVGLGYQGPDMPPTFTRRGLELPHPWPISSASARIQRSWAPRAWQ